MFLKWLQGDGPFEERLETLFLGLLRKNPHFGTIHLGFEQRSLQIGLEPDPERKMTGDILLYITLPYFVDKLLYTLPDEGVIGLMETINHKVSHWDESVAPTPEQVGATESLHLGNFDLVLRKSKMGYPYLDVPRVRRDPITDAVTLRFQDPEHPKEMSAEAASYFIGLHLLDYAATNLPPEFGQILQEFLSHQRTFFLVEGANTDKINDIGKVPTRILMNIFDGQIPHYSP